MAKHDESARERLLADIESVRASGQPDDLPVQVNQLIDSAQRLAEATADTFGSCERGRPFADMFLVARADGKLVWRCTHDPAHPDIPVS